MIVLMSTSPSRPAYGTLAWAEQNNGRLSAREQVRETVKALVSVTAASPDAIRGLLGKPRKDATYLAFDAIPIPDSTFARAAEEEARDSVADPVVQHSLRTYYFGMMLAARDGLSPDPEIAYVASLLHYPPGGVAHLGFPPRPGCAAGGGLGARAGGAGGGSPAARAAVAAEAISLHLNVTVGPESSDEARVIATGAGLDVIALRYAELAPDSIAAVLAQHPRDGWHDELHYFKHESRRGTRAGLLRRMGMLPLARYNAFQG